MSSSGAERGPVGLLADEFLARCKRGERPTIQEYCDRRPDLAGEIRDVFEALLMVEDLKPGSSDVSGPNGESAQADRKRLEYVGDYRIVGEIGRGGMGVVYEAEQQALGRRVALKVLPRASAGDGSAQIRFQREARAAARMHHTNIVPVFDVGQDGEHLYYAMQLIHGQGLDLVIDDLKRLRAQSETTPAAQDRAADRSIAASLVAGKFEKENLAPEGETDPNATAAYEGSLPSSAVLPGQSDIPTATTNRVAYFRSVAQIGVQTASALSYAHGRGIIHRDIKPGNLILDTTGNVWVTDFGLAKTGDGGMTHTGDILGTVRYMSPERFRGQCDVRADVYALGMTLYELLTLKAAYASGDRLKLIEQIRQSEATGPRSVDARIPRDLETIVMKAIDKDPKRRYQSADELGEDLQRFVNDEPIKARRVGAAERLGRWCRRNPAVASLTAALSLILLGVSVASLLAASRFDTLAREQAAAAEKERRARRAADEATEHEAALRIQAEAGFAQARRAVDDYFTTVSESQLLQVPGMQRLRRDLLQSALRFYQDFLKDRGNDPALRGELAAAYLRVGRIRSELEEGAEANKAYEKARELYEALAKAAPESGEWRHGLAQCDFWLGRVDEAIALWDKLVQPNQPRFQKELAEALNSRAVHWIYSGRLSEGLQAHLRALAIREMLVRLNPQDAEAHRDLGGTLNNIGVLLAHKGRPAEALAMYRRAAERAEAAFAQSPQVIINGRSLTIQLANIANIEHQLGHAPEALKAFRRTAEIWRKLANENPAVPSMQSNLWVAYRNLAIYQQELKQVEEAKSTLRLARGVIDRLPGDGPDALFKLACVRAEFAAILGQRKDQPTAEEKAEQKHEADRAMETLRQAVAAGFRDGERLRKAAELNPLRGREDFKALEADVAARAAAAPPDQRAAGQPAPASRRQPVQADSNNQRLQADRAASEHALALIQLDVGKWGKAEEHLGQAVALREALVKAEPKNASYQADLTASRCYLSLVRARRFVAQKRTNEAADALMKMEMVPSNDAHAYKERGRIYYALGQPDHAAADLRRALELWAKVPTSDPFERSRALALLAGLGGDAKSGVTKEESRTFADQSVAALAAAVKTGWAIPSELKEPDFDALRGRPDFQKLLAEVEARAKKPPATAPLPREKK